MKLSLIAAIDEGHLIGSEGGMPWHLPADMKNFRRVTMGKPIIMGRKTYESIGRPLPGRTNIVLTRSAEFHAEGVVTANTLQQALDYAATEDEVMIIGGSTIYELALPGADRLYLTYVENSFEGDAWFPDFDPEQWHIIASEAHSADVKNSSAYRFVTYERK